MTSVESNVKLAFYVVGSVILCNFAISIGLAITFVDSIYRLFVICTSLAMMIMLVIGLLIKWIATLNCKHQINIDSKK